MKNKKLFAILTLVCFMFTLMPVAAFASTSTIADGVVVYDAENSEYVDEVTVEVGDTINAVVTPSGANYVFYAVDEDGEGVALNTNGEFTFKVAGDYKVFAVWDAATSTSALLGEFDTVANKVAKLVAWADSYDLIVEEYLAVSVDDADVTYALGFVKPDTTTAQYFTKNIKADAGWSDEGKVTVKLTSDKASVKNQTLTVTPVGYVDVAFEDDKVTDKDGEVEFYVTSKYVGEYKVMVTYGDAKAVLTVNVGSSSVANVAVNTEPVAPKNIENFTNTGVEFKFTDANGTALINPNTLVDGTDGTTPADYKFTVVSQPAKSKVKADDFYFDVDDKAKEGVLDLKVAANKVKVEGKYVVRVSLANGSYADATFTVAEQGDVVSIMLYEAPKTVAYDATSGSVIGYGVLTMDANGVTDGPGGLDGVVEYSVVGKAVKEFTTSGVLTLVDDADDYIGSKITVYAVYTENGTGKIFTTSNELTVIDSAESVVLKDATAEVGVSKVLKADVVDAKGNVVKLGTATVKVVVLDKPANAVVVATQGGYTNTDGAKVNFLANAAGEYKIQIIVIDSNNKYLTTVETITVGGGVNAFNDVVVLSIGATSMIVNDKVLALDVAPFIEAGRTMMQYTALVNFGIEFAWDEATRSVTAEGNGVKVVMTIDSKVATVNGKTVEMEVAPQIINGRTVIPVTYATNPFGIVAECTYAADGSVNDVLFTK